MTAMISKLRTLAPYAAIELIMPGGSVLALLLWLCRRKVRWQATAGRPERLPQEI